MEKQQEYKIGAAANEFVNEHRAELSSIKKAELEAMLKDFAIQQVEKLNIDDVGKCSVCDSPPIEVERVLDNEIVDFCLKCRKEI